MSAGRGEGLAGLVARLDSLEHTMTELIRWIDSNIMDCPVTLEAAAPASTGFVVSGEPLSEAESRWLKASAAALATPSPQPPASMGVYVALHFDQEERGWPRVAGVYSTYEAAESRVEELGCGATQSLHLDKPVHLAVPAATQEPAGSGAGMDGIDPSHDWRNILGLLKSTIGLCSDEEPHQAISANLWHAVNMIYVLYGGSPRKVGEDGAQPGQVDILPEMTALAMAAALDRLPRYVFCHEDSDRFCKQTPNGGWWVREDVLAALARPSSVPVGEQK